MVFAIAYPRAAEGGPQRLNRGAIAALAGDIRGRLFGLQPKPIDIGALIARTRQIVVNGEAITLSWGLDRPVHDEAGHEALGACETDPDLPGTVFISINASLLAHQPEIIRSAAAHEFAHAIFDMPAAISGQHRRAFRTPFAASLPRPDAAIEWAEWRADEFMGAFLAPAERIARIIPKHASALGLPLRWRASAGGPSIPFLDLDPSEGTLGLLVDSLAESFGVTAAFMSVRLAKGGFIGRPSEHRRSN